MHYHLGFNIFYTSARTELKSATKLRLQIKLLLPKKARLQKQHTLRAKNYVYLWWQSLYVSLDVTNIVFLVCESLNCVSEITDLNLIELNSIAAN